MQSSHALCLQASALTAVTGLGVNSQEFVVSEHFKLGKDMIRRACSQR